MARDFHCRPSDLVGIKDEWMAYWWDEAVWEVGQYELKQKTEDFGAFG